MACENEDIDMFKYLVKHGADVNKKTYYSPLRLEDNAKQRVYTPLLLACKKGNI